MSSVRVRMFVHVCIQGITYTHAEANLTWNLPGMRVESIIVDAITRSVAHLLLVSVQNCMTLYL